MGPLDLLGDLFDLDDEGGRRRRRRERRPEHDDDRYAYDDRYEHDDDRWVRPRDGRRRNRLADLLD